MITEIQLEQVYFGNLEKFSEIKATDRPDLKVYTDRTRGIKSDYINIELKNGDTDNDDTAPYVSCELNRNEALHLKKALEAFIEEIEIDVV